MEKIARWIYLRLERKHKKPDGILYNRAVREAILTLDPAGNTQKQQKDYVIKKFSTCIMIVVIGVLFAAAVWIKDEMSAKIVDNCIGRNDYGDCAKSVVLLADVGTEIYDIPVTIEVRQYSYEELSLLLQKALPALETGILGENASLDKIEYDMNLVRRMDGYPFDVEWYVDEAYMDCGGKLVQDKLVGAVPLELTAVLSCEDFAAEHTMMINVHSKAVQSDNAGLLAKKLQEIEMESRTHKNMTLPSEIDGHAIRWRYKRSCTGVLFLAATPLLALLAYYGRDRDLYMQVKKREEQMRLDYPEIVSAFALLTSAGMTVPNAWNKIARDYKKRVEKEGGSKRYAYEEMVFAVHEMESGTAQAAAYEHFGRRCRIPAYNKLSTLLSQNIRKGAENLPGLLKQEAADAFEERKHMARNLGAKAGTKLLVPMMMILGITMVIIMVPAFNTYL